jgi:YD repeat-containing protein
VKHYIMKSLVALIAVIISLAIDQARAQPQTRFYDSQARSVRTAAPYGNGSVRYYDARGKTLGTSTTTGNTTRFYDASGRPTGTGSLLAHWRSREGSGL